MSYTEVAYSGTLAEALANDDLVIFPYDQILLHAGTYHVTELIVKLHNVTIKPYPGENVTLVLDSGAGMFLIGSGISFHDVILDGLILDGNHVSGAEGIKITNGAYNITVQNCEIMNFPGQGILATRGNAQTKSLTINDNHIHDNGIDEFTHGIYASVDDVTITNNEIEGNAGHGIHIFGGNTGDVATIEKNFVHDNDRIGIGIYAGHCTVQNNVVRDNGISDCKCAYNIIEAFVYFNTFLGTVTCEDLYQPASVNFTNNVMATGTYGFESSGLGTATVTLTNNLINGTTADYYDQTGLTLVDNITQTFNPITDDGADSVVPDVGNPVLSAGIAITGISNDYGGNARGDPPTIGAWEGLQ